MEWTVKAAACVLGVGAVGAFAGPVVFELDREFSGAVSPEGPGPWLIATFEQTAADVVTLTMDATGLAPENSTSFVMVWQFNLASPYEDDLGALTVDFDSGTAAAESVDLGKNLYGADGDGSFDVRFSFFDSGSSRFEDGETSVYTFTATGITPQWFRALSFSDGGGKGPFFTAAHVGGLGDDGDGSGWLASSVPLPSVVGMTFAGLGLMMVRRSR